MNTRIRRILVLTLAFIFLLSFVPQEASAFPYKIEGYLKDSEGVPITLAEITLSGDMYNSSIQDFEVLELYTSTDSNGYYRFIVGAMEPGGFDEGISLTVSYSISGDTVSKTITVQGGSRGSWANLTYSEETGISDVLASPIGLISVVVLTSAVFIGYYMYKSDTRGSVKGEEKESSQRVERRRRR